MKPLLIVLVLVVAGFVGLGFYLGWFHFASDSADDKPNITLTVDPDKFQEGPLPKWGYAAASQVV